MNQQSNLIQKRVSKLGFLASIFILVISFVEKVGVLIKHFSACLPPHPPLDTGVEGRQSRS
jgi:hypothetical protein